VFDLSQLRCFVTVAEELHFGRAATRLNMTQPPLSRQIQVLEHIIDAPLLERTSRSVRLTPAGRSFLPEARRILKLAESAAQVARRIAMGKTGSLKIGFTAAAVAATALMATVEPGMVVWGFVLGVIGNFAYESALVYYNAYLPDLAPPSHQGRVSGWGFAVGYAGSIAALMLTLAAVVLALFISTLAAIFVTEFAPAAVRRALEPVIRLLAGVPSVVYGLIGILALAPWINEHLISNSRKQSVIYVVQLNGANLATGTIILMVMITPIMVAISTNALASVPVAWREGSAALGVNRWRTIWRVSLRTARPAIAAATVLATARALGEAVMLAMVSGGSAFAANPLDGVTFLFEPVRPLAAEILQESEGLSIGPLSHTLYAIGAVLLVSAAMLSLAGWAAKQPLKRYGIRA